MEEYRGDNHFIQNFFASFDSFLSEESIKGTWQREIN